MKRIAFVGAVGAGKTTLFNALRGNYSLARKTQAVEFNDHGDIDTPGEYFSHPRWYHALITTLQDVDTLIYVHAANDKESRLPAGLLDVGTRKRHIAVISKTDMPDAGEWVLLVSGSSARQAHRSELSPVDLCVIGIVDEVVAGGKVVFHK